MSYATKQDLIDRYGERELTQLTDRTNVPPSVVDDTVVARALSDADALCDSYLSKAVALPLSPAPPALTRVAADIARYFLFGSKADKDGPIARAYDQAVAWLRDISKGLVVLDDGTGTAAAPAGDGRVLTSGPDRVFSRDSMRGL